MTDPTPAPEWKSRVVPLLDNLWGYNRSGLSDSLIREDERDVTAFAAAAYAEGQRSQEEQRQLERMGLSGNIIVLSPEGKLKQAEATVAALTAEVEGLTAERDHYRQGVAAQGETIRVIALIARVHVSVPATGATANPPANDYERIYQLAEDALARAARPAGEGSHGD